MQKNKRLKIVALAGGVGGAKLADGLAQLVSPDCLTIIVNTGDDFEHLGLYISPDLDTVCYNLAGINNPETGWGRRNESWNAMHNLVALGGPDWFNLGDNDLGTHLERTRRLGAGQTLSQITRDFCHAWGIHHPILPMSDDVIQTWVDTEQGQLLFQEYFVRLKCQPRVKGFEFRGIKKAAPAPGVLESIFQADLIIICPSNPWVSIQPILGVPGIRDALTGRVVVAVSPIIGGQALKGPAAKMYREMGIKPSALKVAQHYGSILSAFIMDSTDQSQAGDVEASGIRPMITNILMNEIPERARLAKETIQFGEMLLRAPLKEKS
ncbi:MAG: 2-phospho-L-lactate transferase [Anaerolineales bacterium]|nr:2-phospho-L-lactate transferase [Anaerolineales bacterium]